MDDATLADREHANLIAAFVVVANVAGGVVRRADGVASLLSGLPAPNFNLVMVDGDATTPEALAGAVDAARELAVPFAVNLRIGTDDRFIPLVTGLGLVPYSADAWMPGMALHPIPAGPPPVPDGHTIRLIEDRDGVEEHVRIASEVFGIPPTVMSAIVNATSMHLPSVSVYVGYADGAPVSAGLGIRSGKTIGVYNVATLPSARRRGFGEAMTRRIVADGAETGCDVAVLQASQAGLPLYARLGYRTVVSYMGYVAPEAAAHG